MEKQKLLTPFHFFFLRSFFGWLARVQNLISKSRSFFHFNLNESPPFTGKKPVPPSHDDIVSEPGSVGCLLEHEVIELVMGRLGLGCDEAGPRLGFGEISTLFDETEPCLDEVKAAFCVFDRNGDGFIDEGEMGRVMGALGVKEGMGAERCRRMIREYDENGDGLIDFSEFLKVVEKSFC
uniref:EF-hand domain-containing protein n=1 Tax=Kalanchoe fedtschenkoi TaxID=63787 RepID=A0A7N0V0G3_KALFE